MRTFIDRSLNFYKANLHCHTHFSDGSLSPERIKEEYKARGYSAVAFTDHEHIINQSHLSDSEFIAIVGCEIAVKERPDGSTLKFPNMKATHLCLYSKDPTTDVTPCYNSVYDHFGNKHTEGRIKHLGEYERTYSREGISALIRDCKKEGFLVAYNHPGWSLESAEEYLGYEDADFVEIVNTGSIVKGLYDDEAAFAEMLRSGKRIFCTAADDNHNRKPFDSPHSDSFGGFVMINAKSLGYSELMLALENGEFYASEAPEIYSLSADEESIYIECSPAKKISVLSIGRRSIAVYPENGETALTSAKIPLEKFKDGFRIRIEDENGKKAYSQFYTP